MEKTENKTYSIEKSPLYELKTRKKLLEIFDRVGAKENAENLVSEYTNKGIDIINSMNVQNKQIFIDFVNYLLKREN